MSSKNFVADLAASWKQAFEKADTEEKAIMAAVTVVGALASIVLAVVIVLLLVEFLKAVLPFAIGFVLIYAALVRWMDVPAPAVFKKIANYRKQS